MAEQPPAGTYITVWPRGSSNKVRLILYYPRGTAQFTAAFINHKDEAVGAEGICAGACFSEHERKSVSPSPPMLTGQFISYSVQLLVHTKSQSADRVGSCLMRFGRPPAGGPTPGSEMGERAD